MLRVRDTAMGAWMGRLDPDRSAEYIAHSLRDTHEGVFWDIVKFYNLRASTPVELGALVRDRLMDWDLDRVLEEAE